MPIIFLAALILPFAISLALTRWMIALAPRLGMLDMPAARKVHAQPTPLGGGVAIHLSASLTFLLVSLAAVAVQYVPGVADWAPVEVRTYAAGVVSKSPLLMLLLIAATAQMLLGLADDWRRGGLSYQFRLAFEVGLAVALTFAGIRVALEPPFTPLAPALTVLWIVGLTNSLNFLDNMDGLAGGVALLASVMFAAIMTMVGDLFVAGSFLIIVGAVAGFLVFNWSPARIFMGDAGSNVLGFWLAVLTIVGTFRAGHDHVTMFAPLCVLAVPIYDTATVIALRLAQGLSPFKPDKQHFSHRLVALGFRKPHAVLLIYLVTLTTGLGGVLLFFIWPTASPLVLMQIGCMLGIVALLEVTAHWRGQKHDSENKGSPLA